MTDGDSVAGAVREPRSAARLARPRLDFLDGLRGLAAVYVVLGHVYISLRYFSKDVQLPAHLTAALSVFNVGKLAVDVFIVLSGFCLTLPVIDKGGGLPGGFMPYLRRRARRIIPPYYAAIAFSLLVSWLIVSTEVGEVDPNDFRWDTVVSHLALIHNWSERWVHGVNPPMWSVAAEWQIYFLFPLLLLPLWKRFGIWTSVVGAFVLGLFPHFVLAGAFDWTFPWFLGLFALGMAAAYVSLSTEAAAETLRARVPWGAACIATGLATIGFCLINRGWYKDHEWLADPLLGAATACLLIYGTCALRRAHEPQAPLPIRLLGSRLPVWLGAFSYSLYLVHYPLLMLIWDLQLGVQMSPSARAAVMYGLGVPAMLAIAYLFHRAFERPFTAHGTSSPRPVLEVPS